MEQLSLFATEVETIAVSCMTGATVTLHQTEAWMKNLVSDGEYFVNVGSHPLVLRPVKQSKAPQGHEYYHYQIGNKLYSGIFVGREKE